MDVVAAIVTSLFLPYHSFIDSKPSKSITIFLVNKRRNGINESKESSVSFMTINDPLIYEWMNEWMSNEGKQNEWMNNKEKQYVSYDIGYWKVGEKDGMMMIHVHWHFEVTMNWLVMICFGSSKSNITNFCIMEFLLSSFWWHWKVDLNIE